MFDQQVAAPFTLEGANVRYGFVNTTNAAAQGAGLRFLNTGVVTLDNVSVSDNSSAGNGTLGSARGQGGGINFTGGTQLNVIDSAIVNNKTYGGYA